MILTQYHQEEKPQPITCDSRFNKIEEGKTVAYNYSGNVILGTIKKVVRNDWEAIRKGIGEKKWWRCKFEVLIEQKDNEGEVSKIRNPNAFIILGEK